MENFWTVTLRDVVVFCGETPGTLSRLLTVRLRAIKGKAIEIFNSSHEEKDVSF